MNEIEVNNKCCERKREKERKKERCRYVDVDLEETSDREMFLRDVDLEETSDREMFLRDALKRKTDMGRCPDRKEKVETERQRQR